MSEEFDHFLGFGIVITKQYLKRSPYLEEYLKEKFFKKSNLVELEDGTIFLGTVLNVKEDTFLEDMQKAEKDLPQLYDNIFCEDLPNKFKGKMIAEQGWMWK